MFLSWSFMASSFAADNVEIARLFSRSNSRKAKHSWFVMASASSRVISFWKTNAFLKFFAWAFSFLLCCGLALLLFPDVCALAEYWDSLSSSSESNASKADGALVLSVMDNNSNFCSLALQSDILRNQQGLDKQGQPSLFSQLLRTIQEAWKKYTSKSLTLSSSATTWTNPCWDSW